MQLQNASVVVKQSLYCKSNENCDCGNGHRKRL